MNDNTRPSCPHFGECGGCQLQHLSREQQSILKTQEIINFFAKENREIKPVIEPLITVPENSRRRIIFSAHHKKGQVTLGFSKQRSNTIISIQTCHIATPAILKKLDNIKELAKLCANEKGTTRFHILNTENGLDVTLIKSKHITPSLKQKLIQHSLNADYARLSNEDEILIEQRAPYITLHTTRLIPPPASFTQASKEAEQAMQEILLETLKKYNNKRKIKKIADLFSGLGTFTFTAATLAATDAYEYSEAALIAIEKARATNAMLKPIQTRARDLFRRPLLASELKNYQAIILDPPRAGAEAQIKQIAKSNVPLIIMVSCNPKTLANDCTHLLKSNYEITSLTPIDQFTHSNHCEAIAVLTHEK